MYRFWLLNLETRTEGGYKFL